MERVTGIGGIFFKANDPDRLKAWYRDHLGVPLDEHGYVSFSTKEDPGPSTIWSAFAKDTTYFEPSKASFMVNFRVKNLRAMLDQLRKARPAEAQFKFLPCIRPVGSTGKTECMERAVKITYP